MDRRLPRTNKGKSAQRWKDGRRLIAEILPTLPTPSHIAVLWVCWFHAGYTDGGITVFDLTSTQIGPVSGVSPRRAEAILQDLTRAGVIATRKCGMNKGGRGIGAERCITWRPYRDGKQKGDRP